ncbi:MAG: hypothetical protein LC122_12695 [Chitinophagales bacterium]|nr:hypothetical protein [Chitinophagales bacterium]
MKNSNCYICGEELTVELAKKFANICICQACLDLSNPEDDYKEVKNILENLNILKKGSK